MTATIAGIPVYNALVNEEETGMLKISLVDDPAVMSNFQAFANKKVAVKYAIQDEEKRLVRGVVMRADFPIYRIDPECGEYYIIYKAETIRKMAEKYLLESRQNNVNLMHEEGSDVEGVQMVQFFIKDSAAGVDPAGFADIADGSLFGEFHITNDEVWEAVKGGTYQGFSLEGVFNLAPEQDQARATEIADELEGKFNKTNKKPSIMSKFKRIKEAMAQALAKVFAEFGAVTTDKGIVVWDGDEDLKEGLEVFVLDAEGNRTAAAEGDYTTEDNKVIVVVDGKVAEIKDPEAQVAPEQMGKVATDKGEISWNGENELKVGDEVFVEKDGEVVAAEDGDYTTEDGKVIKVAEGKVAEIVEPSADPAPTPEEEIKAKRQTRLAKIRQAFEDSYEEKERKIIEAINATLAAGEYASLVEAGDNYAVVNIWDDVNWEGKNIRYELTWSEAGEVTLGASEEVKSAFVPVDDPNPSDPTAEELAKVKAENDTLKAEVEQLRKLSGGKPAHEEVSVVGKFAKTGNKGLDRIARLMQAE